MPEDHTNTDDELDPETRKAIEEGQALVSAGIQELDLEVVGSAMQHIRGA